jgi:gluconolactonase
MGARATSSLRVRRWAALLGGGLLVAACSTGGKPTATAPAAASPSQAGAATPAASHGPAASTPTASPTGPAATDVATVSLDSLLANGPVPERISSGYKWAEGPLWLPSGRLLFSDVYGNVSYTLDGAGKRLEFRRPSNLANGKDLAPDGAIIQAECNPVGKGGRITRLEGGKPAVVLVATFEGHVFNSPNDLIVRSDGTIWFTDPEFGNCGIPHEIGFNGVYRYDPKTKALSLLTKSIGQPNGIAFSPDEQTLYVANSDSNHVAAYAVHVDGTIGPSRSFGGGGDGIAVDEQGNVWGTTVGLDLIVTAPTGRRIGTLVLPEEVTNLAWGGVKGTTLYITTVHELYRLELTVAGAG